MTHSNVVTALSVVPHPAGAGLDLAARVARLEALLLPSEDRGIPVSIAAERLGVHRNTVHRWIAEGRLTACRWRSRWEVDPTSLARLVALRQVAP